MGGGQLTQPSKQLLGLHQVLVSDGLPVEEGETQVAKSVQRVRAEQGVLSDRVAVGTDCEGVEGRG